MRRDSIGKMKTLDEVIIALEVCTSGYCSHPKHGDCPYLDERNDCDTRQRKLDALHYLREYQENKSGLEKTKEALEVKKKIYEDMTEKIMQQGQENEARCQAEITRYQEAVIELKHKEKEVNDILTDYVALKQYWAEQQANPDLTWEELKQMEGKPVWYEHEFWKGWIILGKVEQGVNCEMIPDREEKWYIVKDGSAKAYRKER